MDHPDEHHLAADIRSRLAEFHDALTRLAAAWEHVEGLPMSDADRDLLGPVLDANITSLLRAQQFVIASFMAPVAGRVLDLRAQAGGPAVATVLIAEELGLPAEQARMLALLDVDIVEAAARGTTALGALWDDHVTQRAAVHQNSVVALDVLAGNYVVPDDASALG